MRQVFALAATSLLILTACGASTTPQDTQAPKATVNTTGDLITSGDTFQVTGTVSDNIGVTKIIYTINGGPATELKHDPSKTSFTFSIALKEGDNIIVVTAKDAKGNTSTAATLNVKRNTAAPNLTITSPTVDTQLLATSATITGSATDREGVASLTYTLNGGAPVNVTASLINGNFTINVPDLIPGRNTIIITAQDNPGNKSNASITIERLAGTSAIQGVIVDQNIGAPVTGSTVELYATSARPVATRTSNSTGTFSFTGMPDGTYTLKARKAGFGGTDVYGIVVINGTTPIRIIQRPAFDTSATTTPAQLVLTTASGAPLSNAEFTDGVNFRIQSAVDSEHLRPLRLVWAALGRTPGSAAVQGSATTTASTFVYQPPADTTETIDSGPVTPAATFHAGFGSATGETVYLEIIAYDFNYNYTHYIVPIKLTNTSATASNTVIAPTAAAATAYTLKQEGSWTAPFAADPGSGTFVDLRWCYNGTVPFAFDIERADENLTFTKIGTVGGATSTSCSATNPLARPFFYRDNSSDLTTGKTFTYRVIARGVNTEASNTTQTTPLAPFTPDLTGPADESHNVPVQATFTWKHPQLAIGADGAAYNIRLRDLMTLGGYNLPGTSQALGYRVEVGTGANGNGIPENEVLAYTATVSGSGARATLTTTNVLTDTAGLIDATRPNKIPVDTTAHLVNLPLSNVGVKLQSLRPYRWEMYSAYAYKYNQNEGGRIEAFSVYAWPSPAAQPIPAARPVTQSFDFTTGE